MEPIRVLHVVTYMGRGGIETMIMNFYRNIDRTKVQFDFLVHRSFEADYDQEIMSLGGKIYHLPKLNPFSRSYLNALDNFFKLHKEYSIVHSHLDCMAGIPLKYAKKNGIPVRIGHAHNNNQSKDRKYLLKIFYKRNIPKYSTHIFACSKEAGKWMFGNNEFKVLNNAIDARKYTYNKSIRQAIRQEFKISEDTFVIGHVGRIVHQKNHTFLLDIFNQVLKYNPESILMIVGNGELKEKMVRKIQLLDINDNVIFTGVRSDVNYLMQAMDGFLFPSLYEGLGIVVIEAQAASLPCIISNKVPIECIKDKNLVKVVDLKKSANYWAKELLKLKQIKRNNTYEVIKNSGFDIKSYAPKLQYFYLSVMNSINREKL